VAATYDGTTSRLFVDGSLVKSQSASGPIATATDELCIGCRSAAGKPRMSFKGALDEVTVSGAAQSADFIKLAYANQRAQQVLVLNPALVDCQSDFGVPPETTVTEGAPFVLKATADCATGYGWAALSGPAPRLLDPEVKTLAVTAPRITKDTSIVYRFTARFGESARNADVTVRVRESIPDPVFTMPAVTGWNGKDSLVLFPFISNLAAVKASRDSVLRFSWTLNGPEADTAWRNGALVLRKASLGGILTVGVCIDNGGPAACRTTAVNIDLSVGLARREGPLYRDRRFGPIRDGLGRLRGDAGRPASVPRMPVFTMD
jgi:hypothetical protein